VSTLVPAGPSSVHLLAALEQVGGVIDNGLILPPDLPYDQYENIGAMLGNLDDMINWLLGDWLIYGEHTYGHKFAQAAVVTGKSEQTLMNVQRIASKIPPQRRRPVVKFSTHGEVAGLPPNDQRRLLKVAETERLTKMELRDRVRAEQGRSNGELVLEREVCQTCGRPL